MLTRLKVNGFKNLVSFDASFGPFTCIVGENGVGKSNIFDAIQFLSLIADRSLLEAAQEVRSSRKDGDGEPEDLFTVGSDRHSMSFLAEMIVPRTVYDDFGTEVTPSISFLRYEVQIGYEQASGSGRHGRLVVEREELRHIDIGTAHRDLRFPHSASKFRKVVVAGKRHGGAFISTELENQRITVHQDGGSRGRPKRALPTRAPTTVVSSINSADDPTVLAVRRELQSWRRLALEPTALRSSDRYVDGQTMGSDGRHLAASLSRIVSTCPDGTPNDVYLRIANRLSGLAGVDIRSVRVDADDTRQLLTVMVTDGEGREFPARSLSEGTLRYLALCVLLEDPLSTGLITMEEPENGIHPASLGEIVPLVRDLAVDPFEAPGAGNPLRQVIVNTHSPAVVQLVGENDLLLAREKFVPSDGGVVRSLVAEGMAGSWRAPTDGHGVTVADLLPFLTSPPGAQLHLFQVA